MGGAGSAGSEVFGRFTAPAHRILDLAREEAEGFGHRYLGPEHVLLGVLAEGQRPAAGMLRAHGVDLLGARAALVRLAARRVVPAPRPSDAELLGSLGIDLAAETAHTLGRGEVDPEHLLLGVLEDARQPTASTRGSRRHRQITAHVGLPDGYQGAAGSLLAALGVDHDRLREAVAAELGSVQR